MNLSPRGAQLARSIAMTFKHLEEHDKIAPNEVDTLLAQVIAHVRSCRSQLLLSTQVQP
jgi:hypothetical protein